MQKHFYFLLIITGISLNSFAQQTIIKGKIIGENNKPLEGVEVSVGTFYTLSKADGTYLLKLAAGNDLIAFYFKLGYQIDTATFSIAKDSVLVINKTLNISNTLLDSVEVMDSKSRFESQINIKRKDLEAYVGVGGSVEGIIKLLPGTSSYNEMSSQYSVRGGNFDENLVYVNGIEVYRPFLVRNGQQEGLSFVNSQMVSNIKFSAGGFEARYGDKMSSVLDITYRQPEEFALTAEANLLGGNLVYEDAMLNNRFSAMVGARYRTNAWLLNSLDTEADFRPRFTDVQTYLTYYINDEWEVNFLGNFSRNRYQVVPQVRTTDFGTFQEALRLEVFFDGSEDYDFTTRFGALSTSYAPNKNLRLTFATSAFQTTEQEYFDVIGAYRLGELNNNLGSDEFGEISFLRGIGGFQNYARNKLDAIVANLDHTGIYDKDAVTWRWGLKYQYEDIIDRYKEWERIDSAGYSIPNQNPYSYDSLLIDQWDSNGIPAGGSLVFRQYADENLSLFESFDSRVQVASSRIMAFVERSELYQTSFGELYLNLGLRTHYWTFNDQNVLSPRASISWKPESKRDMVWRFASGFYYQPPFYREMRDLKGGINENIKAQQSIHFVFGNDYQLKLWNRPFKMITEVYYKLMDNLIPYDLDNVRIRYTAENSATGYATGIDYRINGEFVKGIDSWFSLSLLSIKEDIEGDGAGYLPRPTDQRFSAKVFFQDYLPNDPTFRVSVTGTYGTGLPFGPPQAEPTEKNFRLPPYRRVDIGFIKILKLEGKTYNWQILNKFNSLWVSLEVFNLLATNNTVSYLWIKDISTAREYAVPNYLTGRLLNLKLVAKF